LFNFSATCVEQNKILGVIMSNSNLKDMKTKSNNKNQFPKPAKFSLYLVMVLVFGFMNWMLSYANVPGMETISAYETRLFEAMAEIPEPEPELEAWLLTLSDEILSGSDDPGSDLETRLAAALEPEPEEEPELEEWLMNFSDKMIPGENN
jgi:hypothetical protein